MDGYQLLLIASYVAEWMDGRVDGLMNGGGGEMYSI